jgi:hypothetical protein
VCLYTKTVLLPSKYHSRACDLQVPTYLKNLLSTSGTAQAQTGTLRCYQKLDELTELQFPLKFLLRCLVSCLFSKNKSLVRPLNDIVLLAARVLVNASGLKFMCLK